MSVAQIKEEMRRLSASELADIERFAAELRRAAELGDVKIRMVHPDDPGVRAMMDDIFEKHRELLRRLTLEERREIAREIAAVDQPKDDGMRKAESFAEAIAHVFENYGDLLRRLAQ